MVKKKENVSISEPERGATDLIVGKRTFGVELEFCNRSIAEVAEIIRPVTKRRVIATERYCHNSDNTEWFVKKDSSVQAFVKGKAVGGEIASPAMKNEKDLAELRSVVAALQAAGVEADARCGFHVHLGMEDFDASSFGKFIAHWIKSEAIMLRQVPPERRTNSYCPLIIETGMFRADSSYSESQIFATMTTHSVRYSSINISNWASHKRLEIRLMEGTFNPSDVVNWVRFLLFFVDASKNIRMPQNLAPIVLLSFVTVFDLYVTNRDGWGKESRSPQFVEMRSWFLKRIVENASKHGSSQIEKIDNGQIAAMIESITAKKILEMTAPPARDRS